MATTHGHKSGICAVSGKEVAAGQLVPLALVRPRLAARIRQDHPDLADDAAISQETINHYRHLYVEELLTADGGELSKLDRDVARRIADQGTITRKLDLEEKRTVGEFLSDGLATFGGSWRFLISFAMILVIWITGNLLMGDPKAFDPYPFILLNLVLSCLAAVQAPIIMMSQRRQEDKDRLRSQNDYQVNLKAELEIQYLHEKLDHLMTHQWQRLAEIQQIQLELMEEARRRP
jgi:uncharacterized membrane protein